MTKEQQRIALASGIELDVVDTGPRDAPALIFLHGFPENHRTWRHQIAHFSDRFRCIAPDQRGYRGSSKPEGVENYTPDKLIGDVFSLADALGVGKFTVVGHDWGGAIAWGTAYWGQANGRVERVVIANAPHPLIFQTLLYTNRHQRESSQYMRAFRDPANDPIIRAEGLAGILQRNVRWDSDDRMEPAERAALARDWENRDSAFAMLNWYRASPVTIPDIDEPYEVPAGYVPPPLPNLALPTLVVWGMDDLALPPENTQGMAEVVDDLTLVEVPDSGHFVPWEEPAAVNAAMEAFFERTT